jgi:hypothetical protein
VYSEQLAKLVIGLKLDPQHNEKEPEDSFAILGYWRL